MNVPALVAGCSDDLRRLRQCVRLMPEELNAGRPLQIVNFAQFAAFPVAKAQRLGADHFADGTVRPEAAANAAKHQVGDACHGRQQNGRPSH